MTKILLFNGPPRCGKDTSALRTMNRFSDIDATDFIRFDRFAMPIKHAFAGAVQAGAIDRFGNVYPYEETKSEIIPTLGVSYRQWQIDFSERFMKPLYGIDIFARLFIQRNGGFRGKAIVVPDSGFVEEVGPVVEKFGEENILLLRIHRPGFDFTGDSRSYLPYGLVEHTYDVTNDTTIEDFHEKLDFFIGEFLSLR